MPYSTETTAPDGTAAVPVVEGLRVDDDEHADYGEHHDIRRDYELGFEPEASFSPRLVLCAVSGGIVLGGIALSRRLLVSSGLRARPPRKDARKARRRKRVPHRCG